MKIFTVRDTKAQTFCAPFYSINEFTATRDFAAAARDPSGAIGRNPGDFGLYEIGLFDEESGEMTGIPPHFLYYASDLLNPNDERTSHV